MFARVAWFEGADVDRLAAESAGQVARGAEGVPAGMRRGLVLGDRATGRHVFVSFFDSREAIEAAAAAFESMGDTIDESVRGRRMGVEVFEVVLDADVTA